MSLGPGLHKAGALALCECASTLGGIIGAWGFLALCKAMLRSWDLEGVGPAALWGAFFGVLVGTPLTFLMSMTVFRGRNLPSAGVWG